MLLVALGLSACSNQIGNTYLVDTPDGQASVGKISQTHYLFSSHQTTAEIEYFAPVAKTIKAPLDVLILFDRTMSMENVIKSTAQASAKLVQDVQKIAPDARFAVAAVSDYSPLYTDDADNRTWLLLSDFSLKPEAIETAIRQIQLVNGGDTPEAYSRGLYESAQLAWRQEAKKIIIFFGDATAQIADPGRDETLNTADDLQLPNVLAALHAKEITVIGIHTRNDSEVVAEFKRISQATNGKAVSLVDADQSAQVIKDSINEALLTPPGIMALDEHAGWINTSITENSLGKHGKARYQIHITAPEGTPAGVYMIPLKLTSTEDNPVVAALANKPFELKIITGWINHPFLLWLPLAVLLAYLLYIALSMIRGGYAQTRYVLSRGDYDAERYGLGYLLLDVLFICTIICTCTALYLQASQQVLSQIL